MVGIASSPEQIGSAPPAIRPWLEHDIASSPHLGTGAGIPAGLPQPAVGSSRGQAEAPAGRLAIPDACFDLGCDGASASEPSTLADAGALP